MSLTAKDVEEIVRLLEASQFSRMRLNIDGMKIELERGTPLPSPPPVESAQPAEAPSPPPAPQAKPARAKRAVPRDGLVEVKSPLLGIYYRSPRPGERPFVEVGSSVEEDTVIGIIEVMKLMNSARAGVRGEVVEILVANGESVEHDQPLLLVRPETD